jgi:DNA-directed RNA polymerase specialized sigma24 family protein
MRATQEPVLPDTLLIQRIAALADRGALAELDARHGMTLYAVAYRVALDPNAADAAVHATFREVWRSAASFDAADNTVHEWLTNLTRHAVRRFRVDVLAKHAPRSPKSPSVSVAHPLAGLSTKARGGVRAVLGRICVVAMRHFGWRTGRQQPLTT